MSHGWTKTAAPSAWAASKTGNNSGAIEVPVVDVAADLHAAQPQLATQRSSSGPPGRRLHRQRAQAGKASGMGSDDLGDVIVEQPAQVEAVFRLAPSS